MTVQAAQHHLMHQLSTIYDSREAANIADWVMENLTGFKKIDRLINKEASLNPQQLVLLEEYTGELLLHKPIQYVLHEAWFCGMKLYVDENVLIPRPETEELVEWIIADKPSARSILDVGTGSGCIPIALKKKLPKAEVYACDVSKPALELAMKNAREHDTLVNFLQIDFLHKNNWPALPKVDILVSNPPYIPLKDKAAMNRNVVQYEPHLALFVQDNDPLIFYAALAGFALSNLLPGGAIYAEIHEDLGNSVQELFSAKGFAHTELKKDMQGKNRMIRVSL